MTDYDRHRELFANRARAARMVELEDTQMTTLDENDPALDTSAAEEDAAWNQVVTAHWPRTD